MEEEKGSQTVSAHGVESRAAAIRESCASPAASPSLSTIETVVTEEEKAMAGLMPEATTTTTFQTREPLPELPYSLRTRKAAIAISWSLLLLDACLLPLVLFYILKFVAKLDDSRNLGITNSAFGFFSLLQYTFRLYRLLIPSPRYRPLGTTSRFAIDFYQIQFTLGFIVISVIISLGSAVNPPLLRLLALPPTILLIQTGPQCLLSCYAVRQGWKAPFRMSSTERGEKLPIALFTMIEDIVAVEGGGGREYRAALKKRYQASERFREMLWVLCLIWGVAGVLAAGVTCAVVFTIPRDAAYGFGWSFPFLWAAIMAVWTIKFVQKRLKQEEELWEGTSTTNE